MPSTNGPILPPIPDFLDQFATSFGLGRDEASRLLGTLLVNYEPVGRGEILDHSPSGISETT